MAKIKIVTFHRVKNYGAVLQAYALSNYLSNKNNDVEIIDYFPKYFRRQFHPRLYKHPVNFLKNYFMSLNLTKFINGTLPITSLQYKDNEDLINAKIEADLFIAGSDQIWNQVATSGYDPSFFLNFISNGKKISYAASMGQTHFSSDKKREIVELLNCFSSISIREQFAKVYLSNECAIDASLVIDPTMLSSNYTSLIDPRRVIKNSVICYFVRPYYINRYIISGVKKLLNCQIVNLSKMMIPLAKETIKNSPSDWVSWIYYSKLVVTNSFHGVVFSIIFNKNFIFVPNEETQFNNRVVDLLKKLNLEQRIINNNTTINELISQEIEYSSVNTLLDSLRAESRKFIEDALEGI